jgi:hypothetical protein
VATNDRRRSRTEGFEGFFRLFGPKVFSRPDSIPLLAFGAVTAMGGALCEVAEKAAESGNQIYEAREKTGSAAEMLSGLRAVAKQTGENFGSVIITLPEF